MPGRRRRRPSPGRAATGEGEELASTLLDAAEALELKVKVLKAEDWRHGDAKGVRKNRSPISMQPLVEVKDRSNAADLSTTLIQEYAHAELHFEVDERDGRAKREVEAEAVAYVVGRYFGLDTSNSAFYLAAWQGEKSDVIQDRLQRISKVTTEFIEMIDCAIEANPALCFVNLQLVSNSRQQIHAERPYY